MKPIEKENKNGLRMTAIIEAIEWARDYCNMIGVLGLSGDSKHILQLYLLAKNHIRSQQLVDNQSEDEGLWFIPVTATEDYLQKALRQLHAVVEGD